MHVVEIVAELHGNMVGREAPMEDSRAKWWGVWWRSVWKKETDRRRAMSRTQKAQPLGVGTGLMNSSLDTYIKTQ